MRVLGYNILKGGNGREALLAQAIRAADADIVMLEEAVHPASVAIIADAAVYPHHDSRPGCSTAFMSRIPVKHQWHTARFARSPFLEVAPENMAFSIWGIHLTSMLSTPAEWLRAHEIQMLLKQVNANVPHMLIGDFNTLAPGDTFDKAAMPGFLRMILWLNGGDIRREALRCVLAAGYADAFRQLHPDENGWSIPAWQPNTRLDYAFVSSPLADKISDCRILSEPDVVKQASDHLPILVELSV